MAIAQSATPPECPVNAITAPPSDLKLRRRKITLQDVGDMGKLICQRLTDTEACNVLGINVSTWFQWKSRRGNDSKLANTLSRLKGFKIAACMDGIERAGAKDWRALDRLLERTDPERFVDKRESSVAVAVQIDTTAVLKSIERVYGASKEPANLPPATPAKRLQDAIDVDCSVNNASDTQPVAVSDIPSQTKSTQ